MRESDLGLQRGMTLVERQPQELRPLKRTAHACIGREMYVSEELVT